MGLGLKMDDRNTFYHFSRGVRKSKLHFFLLIVVDTLTTLTVKLAN